MVVIKNDERTGRFRDRSSNIKAYTRVNNVPRSLHLAMLEHLRLHFNNEEASDEQVKLWHHLVRNALEPLHLTKIVAD